MRRGWKILRLMRSCTHPPNKDQGTLLRIIAKSLKRVRNEPLTTVAQRFALVGERQRCITYHRSCISFLKMQSFNFINREMMSENDTKEALHIQRV